MMVDRQDGKQGEEWVVLDWGMNEAKEELNKIFRRLNLIWFLSGNSSEHKISSSRTFVRACGGRCYGCRVRTYKL